MQIFERNYNEAKLLTAAQAPSLLYIIQVLNSRIIYVDRFLEITQPFHHL